MLISAKFEKIEPFSNIIFEEVFFADLPLSIDINANAGVNIDVNVIKSVVPDQVDASESISLISSVVKNIEEIQIDAETNLSAIASSYLFAFVEIDASSSVDIVGSYISGAFVEIDASSDLMMIANRLRSVSVVADFSEIVDIKSNRIIAIDEMSISATTSTVIDVSKVTNLSDVLIGSNIRIDSNNIVLRNVGITDLGLWKNDAGKFIPNPNSSIQDEFWKVDSVGRIYPNQDMLGYGKYSLWVRGGDDRTVFNQTKIKKFRESVGTYALASVIRNLFIDFNAETDTLMLCNKILNTEEMAIDASSEVTIEANVI